MYPMLQRSIRVPVTRVITPLCRGLLKAGLTANAMSVIGAVGSIASAIWLFGTGHFFAGTLITLFFILFDLLDGTMARLSKAGGSTWGALLDSALARMSDAAVLCSIAYYLHQRHDRLLPLLFIAIVASNLVSYVKARSESLGITCNVGFAERTERLIILLLATGLHGLGAPFALAIGMWVLPIASIFTVIQRMLVVQKAQL